MADLITRDGYKAYIGITSSEQDDRIDILVPIVSAICRRICARTFTDYVDDARVEVLYGGFEDLIMDEYPTLAVSSVEYSADYGNTYTTLTEFVDYAVNMNTSSIVCLSSTGKWPLAINGYRITYTAGYETIPVDLQVALYDLVTYYLRNDMAIKSQRTPGSNTVQIEYITKNSLPSHIARIFDLYTSAVN
jgi:hypothetical protein